MAAPLLVVSGTVAIVTGALAMQVALLQSRQKRPQPDRLRRRLFVLWWWSVGAFVLIEGLLNLSVGLGVASDGTFVAVRLASLALVSFAVWALASYLLLTSTQRRWVIAVTAAYYVLAAGFMFLQLLVANPVGVAVTTWSADIQFERPTPEIAIVAAITVPLAIAALSLFVAALHRPGRLARFRGTLISWSLVGWVAAAALAQVFAQSGWEVVARGLMGVVAILMIRAAYTPPGWLQRRYHLPPEEQDRLQSLVARLPDPGRAKPLLPRR